MRKPTQLRQLRRRGIGRIYRNLQYRLLNWRDRFTFARTALQPCSKGSKINQFGYARFQRARSRSKKAQESPVKNDWPEINARNVNLVVNQQADRNQIENDHGNDHAVAKPHTG